MVQAIQSSNIEQPEELQKKTNVRVYVCVCRTVYAGICERQYTEP